MGLAKVGFRNYQSSNLVRMLIESTNVQPSTKAPLLPSLYVKTGAAASSRPLKVRCKKMYLVFSLKKIKYETIFRPIRT
jgi:hypothetical protein